MKAMRLWPTTVCKLPNLPTTRWILVGFLQLLLAQVLMNYHTNIIPEKCNDRKVIYINIGEKKVLYILRFRFERCVLFYCFLLKKKTWKQQKLCFLKKTYDMQRL